MSLLYFHFIFSDDFRFFTNRIRVLRKTFSKLLTILNELLPYLGVYSKKNYFLSRISAPLPVFNYIVLLRYKLIFLCYFKTVCGNLIFYRSKAWNTICKTCFLDLFCGPINRLVMLDVSCLLVFLLIVFFKMKKSFGFSTIQSNILKRTSISYFNKSVRFRGCFVAWCYRSIGLLRGY